MLRMMRNLHYAWRMLRKNPGLTFAVLATLTLGIGAVTAIYTVVYATLLAPLPFPEPNQLVVVWSRVNGHRNGVSAGDYLDWKRQSHSFQQLVAQNQGSFDLAADGQPHQFDGRLVTPGFFNMQGIRLSMGRDFLESEGVAGNDGAVIMTHKLWERLGADSAIIGKTIPINRTPHTVVGVLAPGLADRLGMDLAVPLAFTPQQINHDYHWLVILGRLKPGVSLQQAQQEMDAVTGRIAEAFPTSNHGWGASVELLKNDFIPKERIQSLWLLLGAVGFVLLIACANIANLLLAKGAVRQKEIAVRSSLGATRAQVFLQFLMESLLFALVGGALGIGAGVGLLRAIVAILPEQTLPSEANLHLDGHVLAVALLATTLAGLLFGCAPAWYATRIDPNESLKSGTRSGAGRDSLRLRRTLIVGEFALALALLAGAGLSIHSFWNLTRADLGVRTDHVLTFRLSQPNGRFHSSAEIDSYYRRILDAVRSVTGVSRAATVTGMPLRGTSDGMPFSIVGKVASTDPSKRPAAGFQSVSSDYFSTFGIPIIRGRVFNEGDRATSVKVAVVNEEFARRYLAGVDPLTQRLSIEELIPGQPQLGPPVVWQIVGVVHNVRDGDLREDSPEVDVPFAQSLSPSANIAVRTTTEPGAMRETVAAAVHSVDSEIALGDPLTLDEIKDDVLARDRFTLVLFGCFAGVALLLAAVGVYGLMTFAVSQRTQEIGVRLALGASQSSIQTLIVGEAARLAGMGLALGVAGALLVGRAMQSSLYGVGTMDATVIVTVAMILFVTAVIASYRPARSAAAVDPMQALRTE